MYVNVQIQCAAIWTVRFANEDKLTEAYAIPFRLFTSLPQNRGSMDPAGSTQNHLQFRAVIMLLTLINAINSGGRPLFADDTQKYVPALEENQPTRNRLLNAVTALLVRNHEIVASVVNRSYQHVVAVQQSDNMEEPEDEISGTESEAESDSGNADVSSHSVPATSSQSTRFTAITNPLHTDSYTSTYNYTSVAEGASHQGKFGNWNQLLGIL